MIHFDGAHVSGRRTYDFFTFCELIFGVQLGFIWRFQVSGLSSQVSGVRSQKLMLSLTRLASFLTDAIAYFTFLTDANAYQIFTFLTDAIAYQIFAFLTDVIAYQICSFYK